MPVYEDFSLSYEDGVLTFSMAPPVAIGGMTFQFQMMKRAGGTPIITANMAPGFQGASGITIVDSGNGIYSINQFQAQVSGRDPGAYFFLVQRLDSGFITTFAEGYRNLNW